VDTVLTGKTEKQGSLISILAGLWYITDTQKPILHESPADQYCQHYPCNPYGNLVLSQGSAIGGGLFFISLIGMSIIFWKD